MKDLRQGHPSAALSHCARAAVIASAVWAGLAVEPVSAGPGGEQVMRGNVTFERIGNRTIIRTSDGSRVERFETDSSDLSISTDGQLLYLRNWTEDAPWTKVFDLSIHQVIAHKEWIYAAPASRMNGDPLLVSTHSTGEFSHHMSILSPDGSKLLSEWTSSGYITPITP